MGLEHFRDSASPFVYRLIAILDLHSLFRSWWFLLLLAALAVNILACLLKRLPAIPTEWRGEGAKSSFSVTVTDERTIEEVDAAIEPALSTFLSAAPKRDRLGEGKIKLAWVKHRAYLLGFPFMHCAILVILIGALMGLLYGWKGSMQIEEGTAASQCRLIPSGAVKHLPFTVAVDKFTLTRYPTGQPKEYRSDVRLLKDGQEIAKGFILVNHPFSSEGISLYQSDYKLLGIKEVRLGLVEQDGKTSELTLQPRSTVDIPGTNYKAGLISLDPGVSKKGPGVEIALQGPGEETRTLKVFREEPAKIGQQEVRFLDYSPLYATGLQVAYDPGTIVVWLGCGLLIAGFFLTLFTNYRRLVVHIIAKKAVTEIKVSGQSRRQRREFRESVEEELRARLQPVKR